MSRQDYHQGDLSLFAPPPADTSAISREWIEYRPVNQITDTSVLEFNIPAQSSAYVDFRRSVLNIKAKIVEGDQSNPADSEVLAPINLFLHSIFRQVHVAFQQTPLPHTGTNYPYKSYMDIILNSNQMEQDGVLTSQFFYKDILDVGTNDAKTGSNIGLYERYTLAKAGKIIDMEGPLQLDIFHQPKLLVNGVSIGIKLWQSHDPFRIITDTVGASYKVQIVDARFKLCVLRPAGAVLLANDKLIQDTPAVYPYLRSEIKTVSIAAGQFSYSADDTFQGLVPSKLVVGLVSSAAYNGDYGKNPLNFQHYNCNSVGLYIDCQSFPARPLQPNYEADQYVDCYRTMTVYRKDINVSVKEYKNGYCLYVLDIDPFYTFNTKRRGHCRLELKFSTALPESVTLIMYASFPEILSIDKARAVYVK